MGLYDIVPHLSPTPNMEKRKNGDIHGIHPPLRVVLVREEIRRGPLHVPFHLRFSGKHVLRFIDSHISETGRSWTRGFSIYPREYSVSI